MTSAAWDAWVARAKATDIAEYAAKRIPGLKRNGRNSKELVGPCPQCGGDDRFAISTTKKLFNCRGCRKAGDVIALAGMLASCDFAHACEILTGEPPPEGKKRKKPNGSGGEPLGILVGTYDYTDEIGELLFQTCRYDPKDFRQRRPDGNGGWTWNLGSVRRVLYHLPRLIEGIANGQAAVIVEGERDVHCAEALGLVATCNPMGAGKWKPKHELNEFFRGADVIIVPDNDEAGWKHAHSVGAQLHDIAARVRVLALPAKDLSVWVENGGTREQFDELIASAPEWVAPEGAREEAPADPGAKARAAHGEDELVEALSRMRPGIEFARERAKAARELGVSRSAIDDEVEARRSDREAAAPAPLYGHWVVEPWPEVVDGDALLRDIIARIRKHVTCPESTSLTSALWIMLAWVHDEVSTHSPILNVNSAESESGKTTLLSVASFLMPRCIATVEISEAALYRSIALWRPTFAIDEFDTVLASDDKAGLRAVINSGHTRGQTVIRCIEPDFTPTAFDTFAPKAVGMIGRKMPPQTLSRCVFVELKRKKRGDKAVVKFKHEDDGELANLRSRLLRWSIDNPDTLRKADPAMPPGFDNRRADNWRVMLAIADLAGEDWGDKARAAASQIEGATDTSSVGVRLLADIKESSTRTPRRLSTAFCRRPWWPS